jgi:homospermidine synthase
MINQIYFIGMGSIARSLIEIWQIERTNLDKKITIIEPLEVPKWIFRKFNKKPKHIKQSITKENHKKLLKKLDDKSLVIDLSVEVDCIMIVKKCLQVGACYINTSLENWDNQDDKDKFFTEETSYEDIKKDCLYHRELELKETTKNSNSKNSTIISDLGFNPGFVSIMALTLLDKIAEEHEVKYDKNNKYFYADFCKVLEVESIQIVELDTQITKTLTSDPNTFINSWSSLGAEAEFTDNTMIGMGTIDPEIKNSEFMGYKLIIPDEGDCNVGFLPVRGMDTQKESFTLDDKGHKIEYSGYLIPHGEANTLSNYLQTKNKDYRPSVYYVYSPSEICRESTDYLRENDYKYLKYWYVMNLQDIKKGYDSIGVLFTLKNGTKYILCSVVDTTYVKKMKFKYCNATGLQVAGSLSAGVKYIIERHQSEGLLTPEELPHQWIYKNALRFMGNIFYKKF